MLSRLVGVRAHHAPKPEHTMILENHHPALDDVQRGRGLTPDQVEAARCLHHDPRYRLIPAAIVSAFYHWVRFGDRPGGFVSAVLRHDLVGAVAAADTSPQRGLVPIVVYMVNELPMICHGSAERMDRWAEQKQREREQPAHPPPVVPAATHPHPKGGLAD
ncbi:MAG: hypothetical protein AAGG38_13525 [Planctomycetota bacterium]